MVTKNKNTNEQPKSRAQVGKLQLNKETVKELTVDKLKHIKGGLRWGDTWYETCTRRSQYKAVCE